MKNFNTYSEKYIYGGTTRHKEQIRYHLDMEEPYIKNTKDNTL